MASSLRLMCAGAALVAAQLTIALNGSAPLNTVDETYVAYNIDTGSLYNGMNFSDTKFRTLVGQLAPSMIRIGGTAVDSSFYFPDEVYHIGQPNQCRPPCPNGSSDIGNAMIDAVWEFARATDMKLLWDLNGESFRSGSGPWDPSGNATAMLGYINSVYGGRINYSYSVGNEPDLWKAPHTPSAATLGGDAVTLVKALNEFNIGKDVYGASWAGISATKAQDFLSVAAAGGVRGYTVSACWCGRVRRGTRVCGSPHYLHLPSLYSQVHNYPYGGKDCVVNNYLDKTPVTTHLGGELAAVAAVAKGIPDAEKMLLVLEETAGSSGGGCEGVTDRYVAGFCWMNTLNTVSCSAAAWVCMNLNSLPANVHALAPSLRRSGALVSTASTARISPAGPLPSGSRTTCSSAPRAGSMARRSCSPRIPTTTRASSGGSWSAASCSIRRRRGTQHCAPPSTVASGARARAPRME